MRNQGNVCKRNTESLKIFAAFLLPLKVTQPLHYTLSQALLFSATKLCSNLRLGASTNNQFIFEGRRKASNSTALLHNWVPAVVSGDVKPCVCLAHWQKDLTPAS